MIAQGFQLMVVGMTVVFLFLTALVAILRFSAYLFTHLEGSGADEARHIAVAVAAAYDRDVQRGSDDA